MEEKENERKVLEVLDVLTDSWGEFCVSFSWIMQDSKLTLQQVRTACRSLRKKGFVQFHKGLMDDEGKVAGSGYCISIEGQAYLNPCDVCGEKIMFEYDGKKECEEHYGKSNLSNLIKK